MSFQEWVWILVAGMAGGAVAEGAKAAWWAWRKPKPADAAPDECSVCREYKFQRDRAVENQKLTEAELATVKRRAIVAGAGPYLDLAEEVAQHRARMAHWAKMLGVSEKNLGMKIGDMAEAIRVLQNRNSNLTVEITAFQKAEEMLKAAISKAAAEWVKEETDV